ncbi:MAG: hypothetical protein AVDCRST_MAG88-765, partial [uncultured Thermomicrobiales bacterium]
DRTRRRPRTSEQGHYPGRLRRLGRGERWPVHLTCPRRYLDNCRQQPRLPHLRQPSRVPRRRHRSVQRPPGYAARPHRAGALCRRRHRHRLLHRHRHRHRRQALQQHLFLVPTHARRGHRRGHRLLRHHRVYRPLEQDHPI